MNHHLIAGLSFGDESKGSCTDWIVREIGAKMVVRYNGACQCAHNVMTDDGRHHEFHQFGSGSFAGASTYLSRFMLIEPYALMNERSCLYDKLPEDPIKTLYVERGCTIITPFHWITNQLREQSRGSNRHGSCGMGVGEARQDQLSGFCMLTMEDLTKLSVWSIMEILNEIRTRKCLEVHQFGGDTSRLVAESVGSIAATYISFAKQVHVVDNNELRYMDGPFVFEGAQGMLLDEVYGSAPHNTWTDCTFKNAIELLGPGEKFTKVGVLRSYMTRHGAGPFPTESPDINWPDHNKHNDWQQSFRQGRFDLSLARYALKSIGGVDMIALSHMDRVSGEDGMIDVVCRDPGLEPFEDDRAAITIKLDADGLADALNTDIGILSHGPCTSHKSWYTKNP